MLTDEEVERFKKFRLDHIWKDTNALYLEKDYPPPASYERWNRNDQAALLNSPIPMKPTRREKVILLENGVENAAIGKEEEKGINIAIQKGVKFQIPPGRPTSSLLVPLQGTHVEEAS